MSLECNNGLQLTGYLSQCIWNYSSLAEILSLLQQWLKTAALWNVTFLHPDKDGRIL